MSITHCYVTVMTINEHDDIRWIFLNVLFLFLPIWTYYYTLPCIAQYDW